MNTSGQNLAISLVFLSLVCTPPLLAQLPQTDGEVDFGRDVRPLLRAHCLDCHGPDLQQNSFRLDRRSDAMRGGTGTVIGAGDATASRLYLKLIGDKYGARMPTASSFYRTRPPPMTIRTEDLARCQTPRCTTPHS